jgi:hypothetical protein
MITKINRRLAYGVFIVIALIDGKESGIEYGIFYRNSRAIFKDISN